MNYFVQSGCNVAYNCYASVRNTEVRDATKTVTVTHSDAKKLIHQVQRLGQMLRGRKEKTAHRKNHFQRRSITAAVTGSN